MRIPHCRVWMTLGLGPWGVVAMAGCQPADAASESA
jgi:hypothetical protein